MNGAPRPVTPRITGTTRIVAHLGVPTEGFTSPMIYNPWFAHAGIDAVVVPMGVEPEGYPAFLSGLFALRNIAGALVTMPHKVTTAGLLDRASPAVAACGACNAVRRGADGALEGEMFDGAGFVAELAARGLPVANETALVAGCGGVGSAIAAALAAAGAARLILSDPAPGAAPALADRLSRHFPATRALAGPPDPAGCGIVVNASPLGMRATDPLPLDPGRIEPGATLGCVILSDRPTPLLAAAAARGCATVSGRDMLFRQIPLYLDYFGLPSAPPDTLRRLADL